MAFFFFVLGAIIASFMGLVASRLYTELPIRKGRSRCDACGRALDPLSLVPVLSFMLGRGRARCCGSALSPYMPLGELALGALFAVSFLKLGLTWALLALLTALSLLFALVLYDVSHQILPSVLLAPFVIVAAITGFLESQSTALFSQMLAVALGLGAFLALIHFASRGRAMGLADAPLSFGLALLAGPLAFSGFVYSFWIGALCGIAVLLGRPRGSRMGVEVPFAPYLSAGFLFAYFTQWNILDFIGLLMLA